MYNYNLYEVKETVKAGAQVAGAVAFVTIGTYGGSKLGHAIVDGVEDVAAAATKEIGKSVKKAVKKTFKKKRFFGII